MEKHGTVSENLAEVHHRMDTAAAAADRNSANIALVAVSKTVDASGIVPALDAGQRIFGENRVQEAKAKWPALRERYPDIELHLIGPLQSNKAHEAVALFDVIQTVDRPKIAEALAAEMDRQGRAPKLFVQVNIGNEPQKAGIAPEAAVAFVEQCRREFGLSIEGLMCIPPHEDDPEPHFRKLAQLGREAGLRSLSMGMSADFEEAIRCGATYVRVGSAIFGERA